MLSKVEGYDRKEGERRTRAKTPLYKGKRIHKNVPGDDGDNASNSGAGLKPSAKKSSCDEQDSDDVPPWMSSKQSHGSKSKGAATLRRSILNFEEKMRRSRSKTPKSRLTSKECDDFSAGKRSAERSPSRARKHKHARSPSTTSKKLGDSSKTKSTFPNELNKKKPERHYLQASSSVERVKDSDKEHSSYAGELQSKKKEAFYHHQRLSRLSNHATDLDKEDAKQTKLAEEARTTNKGKDHESNQRVSLYEGNAPDSSSLRVKRRVSRDDFCVFVTKAQVERNSSMNESSLCHPIAGIKKKDLDSQEKYHDKEESDSKDKHHDSNERPTRRKTVIERRHSDATGKLLIIDRKDVMARRNSMTDNRADLLMQSRKLDMPRSTSTGLLKETVESDKINDLSTLAKRSESKTGAAFLRKDSSSSKETPNHINKRNITEDKYPSKTGTNEVTPLRAISKDSREVIARRNSMTENKEDSLRQSKRITISRSTSMGSLKKLINSADGDAITSAKRSDSKAGTTVTSKEHFSSLKERAARTTTRNMPEAMPPPKTTTKDVVPLGTISKESTNEDQKKYERKPSKHPIETAAPVSTPAAVAVIQEPKGIPAYRVTICAVCVLYTVSLALAGVLGFWFHMIVYAKNNEKHTFNGNLSFGIDATTHPDVNVHEVSLNVDDESNNPSLSPTSLLRSVSYAPLVSASAPNVTLDQLLAGSKRPPPSSIIPTISLEPTSSPVPIIRSHNPSAEPSYTPPTSSPTFSPSTSDPTLSLIPSLEPSMTPSASLSPSSSPTGIAKCPDELLKIADLGEDSLITMRYEIVPLPLSDPHGGLFCVSIEHEGNAGWIGFAVSSAARDPAFGRKEAIIGIPGVMSMVAVAPPGADAAVGQQVGTSMVDGPKLFNPGKYEIPAGGVDGYTGPSIDTMLPPNRQTLNNATIAFIGPDDNPLQKPTTTMTFTKFLREPNEIEIDPFKSTLFLYAVATVDEDGEYNDRPEWIANYVTLFEIKATTASRKRLRRKGPGMNFRDTTKG